MFSTLSLYIVLSEETKCQVSINFAARFALSVFIMYTIPRSNTELVSNIWVPCSTRLSTLVSDPMLYTYRNNTGIDKHKNAAWYTSVAKRSNVESDFIKKTLLTPMRQSETCKIFQLYGNGDCTLSDIGFVGSGNKETRNYINSIPRATFQIIKTQICPRINSWHHDNVIQMSKRWKSCDHNHS